MLATVNDLLSTLIGEALLLDQVWGGEGAHALKVTIPHQMRSNDA